MNKYSNSLKSRVSKIVDAVRDKYKIEGFIFSRDFYRICREERIRIITNREIVEKGFDLKLLQEVFGGFFYFRRGMGIIWVNKGDAFTACHELGHYFCNHPGNSFLKTPTIQRATKEREADYFAELMSGMTREESDREMLEVAK